MSLDLLDVDFSSTCDATGSVTIPLSLNRTYYATARVVATTTGNAQWSVLVNGRPVTFGRGARCDIGPVLIAPTDRVSVTVLNASAGVAVSGKVVGVTASTLAEALEIHHPAPNTIALDTASPGQTLITQRTIVPGAQFVSAVQLQPGFHGLGFLASVGSACRIAGITGEQSGAMYLADNAYLVDGLTVVPIVAPNPLLDTSVQITVNNISLANLQLWIFGIFDVEQFPALNQVQAAVPALAAPWQAPTQFASFNASIAAGAAAVLIAAGPTGRVYLHGYCFGTDGANAAGRVVERQSGGTIILDMNANATRGQIAVGSHNGVPTTAAGQSIEVVNSGAAASFIAANQDNTPV